MAYWVPIAFLSPLGNLYPVLINAFEVLALLVIIACSIFLIRRNGIKLKRFISKDLDGWPHSDANYILITEIVLMTLFLTMNATDRSLQLQAHEHYKNTGDFAISSLLLPLFQNMPSTSLVWIERSAWWLHIIGILAF